MSDLRQKIIQINSRTDISQNEKSKLIFEAMNPNFNANNENKQEEELEIDCPHYKRNCSLKCIKCNKFYPCRICHDEHEDHKLERHKVKEIRCRECNFVQEKSSHCLNCSIEFSRYYCSVCTLYDDAENKIITHCDKCGICRLGETIHCDKCDMCYDKSIFDSHRCNGKFDDVCPICHENLKDSTTAATTLPCGHKMHHKCFQNNLMNGNYQCPLCKKSTTDMTSYWEQISQYVENSEMPPEYRDVKAEVYCNDCEEKTITKFHFAYHKCQKCPSWNTSVINTFKDNDNLEENQVNQNDNQNDNQNNNDNSHEEENTTLLDASNIIENLINNLMNN